MASREVKVNTGTEKFLGQHGNVEMVGVETGKVAAGEGVAQTGGKLLEGGGVFHHVVADARDAGHLGGYGAAGIHKVVATLLMSVGENLNV